MVVNPDWLFSPLDWSPCVTIQLIIPEMYNYKNAVVIADIMLDSLSFEPFKEWHQKKKKKKIYIYIYIYIYIFYLKLTFL